MKNLPINENIAALQPYVPGKPISELMREFGLSDIVKLASNENPLGVSPKAKTAMQMAIETVNFYPDGNSFELKQALADFYQLSSDQLVLGNGSNDVLDLIARTFLSPEKEVIFSQYAFAVYPIVTQLVGATAVEVPAHEWGHDLDAMLSAITDKTAVIFIANPNNPTGTLLEKDAVEAFLQQVPAHIIVVLDEAYAEYLEHLPNYPRGVDYLAQYPNLIVTRTFSKIYGLAGLRIGYGMASSEIINVLNRARQPFNVNLVAQAAAEAALKDSDYVQRSVKTNTEGLEQLAQGLDGLDIEYIESYANFITFKAPKASELYLKLLEAGVIVRPLAGYKMADYLRVSVGDYEQNRRFLLALIENLDAE